MGSPISLEHWDQETRRVSCDSILPDWYKWPLGWTMLRFISSLWYHKQNNLLRCFTLQLDAQYPDEAKLKLEEVKCSRVVSQVREGMCLCCVKSLFWCELCLNCERGHPNCHYFAKIMSLMKAVIIVLLKLCIFFCWSLPCCLSYSQETMNISKPFPHNLG